MFYLVDFLRTSSPGGSLSDSSEELLQKDKEEPGYIGILQQKPGSQNIKRLLLKEIKQLKLMPLVLFCVYEGTEICPHWTHSFDIPISYLGLVSCSFPSWVPSGYNSGVGCSGSGLGTGQPICLHPDFSQGSPSGQTVVAWWLQHPLFTDMAGNILE